MTTDRKTGTLHIARQIFKHDGIIHFRIYVSAFPLPKMLRASTAIYSLTMHTNAVDKLKMNYLTFIDWGLPNTFDDWDSARDWLIGEIFTVSRKYGFKGFLVPYHWSI